MKNKTLMTRIIKESACSLIILLLLNCIACTKSKDVSSTNSNTQNSTILPLAVGNKWTYKRSSEVTYSDGSHYSDSTYIDTFTVVITKTQVINNTTCYIAENLNLQGQGLQAFEGLPIYLKSDGLWGKFYNGSSGYDDELIIKYPVNTLNYQYGKDIGGNPVITVTAIDGNTTVPKGTFKTTSYQRVDGKHFDFSDKTGLIKEEFTEYPQAHVTNRYTFELISYTLN